MEYTSVKEKDNCQACWGQKGGVRGNENRVGGMVLCDYCTAKSWGEPLVSPEGAKSFEVAKLHNSYVWRKYPCPVEQCPFCEQEAD